MAKKEKKVLPDDIENSTASAEEIMRKYDRESATRIWSGTWGIIVKIILAVFSLYCIYSTLYSTADMPIRLSAFLGLIIIMGYLTYPSSKRIVKENYIPWYDFLLMILGAGAFFYYCFNYMMIVKTITSASAILSQPNPWFYYALGIAAVISLAELCRRCVGIPILCVVGALLIYTFVSMSGNNQTFLQVFGRVIYTLFYGTSGLMATPVQVCLKFIAVFIIFGAFLERTGISSFFIDLANSVAGSASGGPAKVAVISSALCGMVSGSSVGNTVTTGSVTIPMMKRTGYKPEFAGAVEAASSTGGQIMPPIMGAAAFLMAEYVGAPYGQIVVWAILPAVLYFFGIFIAVHLEAKKLGLKGIPRTELPSFFKLQRYVYLLLPLIVLIYLVATNTRSLQYSASIAIILAILVSFPGEIKRSKEAAAAAGDKKPSVVGLTLKETGSMILNSLEAGGRGCRCMFHGRCHRRMHYRYRSCFQADHLHCCSQQIHPVSRSWTVDCSVPDDALLHRAWNGCSYHSQLLHHGIHHRTDSDHFGHSESCCTFLRVLFRNRSGHHSTGGSGCLCGKCHRKIQSYENRCQCHKAGHRRIYRAVYLCIYSNDASAGSGSCQCHSDYCYFHSWNLRCGGIS